MFAEDATTAEPSNLERFAAWADRAKAKVKTTAAQVKTITSAGKDVASMLKKPTPEQIAADKQRIAAASSDEIYGIPSTYVYVGAGLLITAGLGYIVYNRMKN